jgi:hypothetical protein
MPDGGQLVKPVNAQLVFSSSSVQNHPIGCKAWDVFGREFKYARAGATALVAGNAQQGQAQIAHHQDMAPTATAIGASAITVTPGATAGAADLYAGGVAVIDTTPGEGYSYPIKTHLAITSATAFVVQLQTGWTIQVALTTSSRVSLYPSPYRNTVNFPTTATGPLCGVAMYPTAIAEYGWLGVNGLFGTQIDGTPAVGTSVGCPSTAAGAVGVVAGTDAAVPQAIAGSIADTGQDGKWEGVNWTL